VLVVRTWPRALLAGDLVLSLSPQCSLPSRHLWKELQLPLQLSERRDL
jgi:hypothetical protein